MHSGLAKTFSPNTRKNSYFGLLLHATHSQFRAAYWPDHQLVCLTVLLSLPVFPAKLLLCWHYPPFTTLQMLHLSSFLPQIFFFLISVFRRLPDRFLFACVMEHYFTNCFGSQSTVGLKFYLVNQNIHPQPHKHRLQRDSAEAFEKQYWVSFLDAVRVDPKWGSLR